MLKDYSSLVPISHSSEESSSVRLAQQLMLSMNGFICECRVHCCGPASSCHLTLSLSTFYSNFDLIFVLFFV